MLLLQALYLLDLRIVVPLCFHRHLGCVAPVEQVCEERGKLLSVSYLTLDVGSLCALELRRELD